MYQLGGQLSTGVELMSVGADSGIAERFMARMVWLDAVRL